MPRGRRIKNLLVEQELTLGPSATITGGTIEDSVIAVGEKLTVESGGEIEIESGGWADFESGAELRIAGTALTVAAAEINKLDAAPFGNPTYVIGADAGTTITINIQLKDGSAADLAVRGSLFAYLSDDANGDSIVAAAPSGGWAAGTDGVLIPVVAGKAAVLVSEADGDIDIVITEAGTKSMYLIFVLPNGKLVATTVIAFAA